MLKRTLLLASITIYGLSNSQCTPTVAGQKTGDVGCVQLTYQNKTVYYKTVRAADGNEWLQQNLGSSKVAEQISDKDAYGDYFQYGRWDDGHQLATSKTSEDYPTPNNPKGLGAGTPIFYINGGTPWAQNYTGWWANPLQNDSWTAKNVTELTDHNGIDPCKAIGDNWEMPSETDWDIVMQKELIFPKPTGATNNGMTRAFESNLKIAGAGSRKDDGWAFVDSRAYLWTKSPSTNPNFYRYAYLGSATTSTTGFGGDAKSFGYSVRCVNKSKNLGLDLENKNTSLKIVPNPAQNNILISTSDKVSSVEIFNLLGQILITEKNTNINISKLQTGTYFVKIKLQNGTAVTQKLIKN
ncbi:T9SS type A sorting domain-containing protein [Soonwooa sp.]|uniref:T9SS type A sorting domain-containing protein n=1 Tax=Soonwooa sp. TaxID=1938592 RepID=UPI002601F757|nr:T9SS type A sorting domain-containing protein [Soonwooa sp.]